MKFDGRTEVKLHRFLTSALDGGVLSASSSGFFTPGKDPRIRWVGCRTVVDAVVKTKLFADTWNRTPVVQPVVSREHDTRMTQPSRLNLHLRNFRV
jgi:hypothetical protein